jgi:hypothetical protein
MAVALQAGTRAAAGERAFAGLEFGESGRAVEQKLRGYLGTGGFERSCYGCPVGVALGPHVLSVAPDFWADRLWRVVVSHSETATGPGRPRQTEDVWELLRETLESKYGPASSSRGGPRPLPDAGDVDGASVLRSLTWERDGKRIRLSLEVDTSFARAHEPLRARILAGWLPGRGPDEDRIVHYRVQAEITDPSLQQRREYEVNQDRTEQRREQLSRARELF